MLSVCRSDATASQCPVLVLPQSFLPRLGTAIPQESRPYSFAPPSRRLMWLELAELLLRQQVVPPKVARSVNYLLRVGQGQVPPVVFQPLPWHEEEKSRDLVNLDDLHSSRGSTSLLLPVANFKANLRKS